MTELSPEKLARLFLLGEFKPFPDRKVKKNFCIWWLSCFRHHDNREVKHHVHV